MQQINGRIIESVKSIEINAFETYKIKDKTYNLLDIPGIGFFREKILENIPYSRLIIVFIDSYDK